MHELITRSSLDTEHESTEQDNDNNLSAFSEGKEFIRFLESNDAVPIPYQFTIETYSKNDASFSTSKFKKDFGTVQDLTSAVFNTLRNLQMISGELVTGVFPNRQKQVNAMLDKLCRRGFLTKYGAEGINYPVYTLTPFGLNLFEHKETADFLNCSRHLSYEYYPLDEDEELSAYFSATRFVSLANSQSDEKIDVNLNVYHEDSFAAVADYGAGKCMLGFGMLALKAENVQNELSILKNKIAEAKPAVIVFAGLNKENARKLSSALRKQIAESIPDEVQKTCYMDVASERIYDCITDEEVSKNELFSVLTVKVPEEVHEDIAKAESVPPEVTEAETTEEVNAETGDNQAEAPAPAEEHAEQEFAKTEEVKTESAATEPVKSTDPEAESYHMISNDMTYAASAYLKAVSMQNPEYRNAYDQLAYAIGDPLDEPKYDSENMFRVYQNQDTKYVNPYYLASASLRLYFFNNDNRYNRDLAAFYNATKDSYKNLLSQSNEDNLTNLLFKLKEFRINNDFAVDSYADYQQTAVADNAQEINRILSKAKDFEKNYFDPKHGPIVKSPRMGETKRQIFGTDSDLYKCWRWMLDDPDGKREEIRQLMCKDFIEDDAALKKENISQEKIQSFIDEKWAQNADLTSSHRKGDIFRKDNAAFNRQMMDIISTIADWYQLTGKVVSRTGMEYKNYQKIKPDLMNFLNGAIEQAGRGMDKCSEAEQAGRKVLISTLSDLRKRTDGTYQINDEDSYFYIGFLQNGYVPLNEHFLPDGENTEELPEFSMVDRIRLHTQKQKTSLEVRLQDYCGDDYGSAQLIAEYLYGKDLGEVKPDFNEACQNCELQAKNRLADFKGEVELAQMYGQIDNTGEDKKESILRTADRWYEITKMTKNFAFFGMVLDSLKTKIAMDAEARGLETEAGLETTINGIKKVQQLTPEMDAYISMIRKTIADRNYSAAQEYTNRLSAGLIDDDRTDDRMTYFDDFLHEFNFDYKLSAGKDSLRVCYVNAGIDLSDESNHYLKLLCEKWLGPKEYTPNNVTELMNFFGFRQPVVQNDRYRNGNRSFLVKSKKPKNGKKINYRHSIAAFGSQAETDGYAVILLNNNKNYVANDFTTIRAETDDNVMFLLDGVISMPERRKLARKLKESPSTKACIVVDRVIATYLARHYSNTTINQQLMAVTMPYSYYQPYVYHSGALIPPEMFVGRGKELQDIEDKQGINILYGGRQLGKSALLHRAEKDIDNNEKGYRAVFVDLKGCGSAESLDKITQTMIHREVLSSKVKVSKWSDLTKEVKNVTGDGPKKIPFLLLLLDEADAFIEDCSKDNYHEFDELKQMQDEGYFKFVVAGLRNVVKFSRDAAAVANNSVLPHMASRTVKPLPRNEALELLEKPLAYLGMRFPEDKQALVASILASTNYFPGLIQFYCARLIEAMKDNYAGYREGEVPPYVITEKQIKKVLGDKEFRDQVVEKFQITLRLDADDYYYIIALAVAVLDYENPNAEGFTADDVINECAEYEVGKIIDKTSDQIEALMEEMKDLNVFRTVSENHYVFSNYNFRQILGDKNKVEEDLLNVSIKYAEVEENGNN